MHEYGGCPGIVDDHVPVTYPVAPAIILSPEQQGILERVKRGENVFFTGSAGTGKSVLLKEIIRHFCPPCFSGELAITASTGIAAINIGGQTLHSWAGIKFGQEPAVALYNKLSEEAALRWQLTQTLIIDEGRFDLPEN
ncbi:hypothetical protein BV25DRAFT_458272 [Artomyces pyxidatus]|uniref:Uncharacterized protein n=1 Tax=Artomyces pyxidatus TaxID=48021 RepID=A0ACB8T2X3_9AGAM|nr:hypothetical protein BV25DRAFT_458272 [Artomyces pyxidatus]